MNLLADQSRKAMHISRDLDTIIVEGFEPFLGKPRLFLGDYHKINRWYNGSSKCNHRKVHHRDIIGEGGGAVFILLTLPLSLSFLPPLSLFFPSS